MRSVLTALCFFASSAHAVPAQFTHQGRLLDVDGVPLDGEASITFRIITEETGGVIVWEEPITVSLSNGFYAAVLGTDEEENPLDVEVLNQAPVWLELQMEGVPAMFPRTPIHSVPYATMATVAEEVSGGPVDASEVAVDGALVINDAGEWVGPAPTVNWADLEGIPEDFADGIDDDTDTDTDSFADLGVSCLDGDVPVWDGVAMAWGCGLDQDSLADIACLDGQLIRWSDESVGWLCADDVDTVLTAEEVDAMVSDNGYAMASEIFSGSFTDLVDLAPGLADGDDDTQLTAAEVDAIVADNGYAMASDVFSGSFADLTEVPEGLDDGDDDSDTLNALDCSEGQVVLRTADGWACSSASALFDSDEDGILSWNDCDDSDPTAGATTDDQDCDGFTADEDCDDEDATSAVRADEGDCDDIPYEYDCSPTTDEVLLEPDAVLLGADESCPAASCSAVQEMWEAMITDSTWEGGNYFLGDSTSASQYRCEPDDGDPWTYIVNLDADEGCPPEWTAKTTAWGAATCARNSNELPLVRARTYAVPDISYTEIKGSIESSFLNSVDGFNDPVPTSGITNVYLDGVGVRIGDVHIYSLALGHAGHHCARARPSYVDEYDCIIGTRSHTSFTGPHSGSWSRTISPTSGDITVQLMADSGIDDEDVAVQSISIAVR